MNTNSVTILLYHGVNSGEAFYAEMDARSKEYILSKELFQAHMKYLYDNNYNVLLLEEYLRRINSGQTPRNVVVLTFDDGEKSCHKTIAPILEKFNFKGNFFIISNFIGKDGYMDAKDIKDLSAKGHAIESHSVNHPFLTKLDNSKVYEELKTSKEKIEALIGREVAFFSIPTGAYNKKVLNAARSVGYKKNLCSVEGYNIINENPFTLKRFAMHSYTGTKSLAHICENKISTARRIFLKRLFAGTAKSIFTFKIYNKLRDFVVSKIPINNT